MTIPPRTERLSISSTTDKLEIVDEWIESIARRMGFDEDALADLGICVTEAAMNAMTHGHCGKPECIIDLTAECLEDRLRISVRDYGSGFDESKLADPTTPENLLKDCGRGIMLMRKMMDEVVIEHLADGTRITMVKALEQG